MKSPKDPQPTKKTYQSPRLTVYGAVRELTGTSTMSIMSGDGGMNFFFSKTG